MRAEEMNSNSCEGVIAQRLNVEVCTKLDRQKNVCFFFVHKNRITVCP